MSAVLVCQLSNGGMWNKCYWILKSNAWDSAVTVLEQNVIMRVSLFPSSWNNRCCFTAVALRAACRGRYSFYIWVAGAGLGIIPPLLLLSLWWWFMPELTWVLPWAAPSRAKPVLGEYPQSRVTARAVEVQVSLHKGHSCSSCTQVSAALPGVLLSSSRTTNDFIWTPLLPFAWCLCYPPSPGRCPALGAYFSLVR